MYGYSTYGPTFGGGHDFMLSDNCNVNTTSYSNFNHSYDSKGKTNINLTGAYNFQVDEVEVFALKK